MTAKTAGLCPENVNAGSKDRLLSVTIQSCLCSSDKEHTSKNRVKG